MTAHTRCLGSHNGKWQQATPANRRFAKRAMGPVPGTPAHAMALDIAAAFTDARTALGLSQKDLAAALGICYQTVAAFERGRPVHLGIALRMIDHIGLTLAVDVKPLEAAS